MRQQRMLIPTLRDVPGDAEAASHRLMLRAGLVRQLSSGIYSYLPLGLKALQHIQTIVREELDAAGAQEMLMPALHPSELWKASGRWDIYGPELMRLEDRHGREFALGATHEEVITTIVKDEIQSYKKLPVTLYQIQTKYRDERRPRFGLLRGREFLMKDAYSFDRTATGLDESYQSMYNAYERIFTRCGLNFRAVEADSGAIGGTDTHEFMALADIGEDTIVHCPSCQYAANLEKAVGLLPPSPSSASKQPKLDGRPKKVHTPKVTSIKQLSEFLPISPKQIIKSIAIEANGAPVIVLLRGDCEVNEIKLKNVLGASEFIMLSETDIQKLGSIAGFIGPIGLQNVKIIADSSVMGLQDAVVGANEADYHLVHVDVERDLADLAYHDLRNVTEGECCMSCGHQLSFAKGIEVGHVFKLGTKYSQSLGALFSDENGASEPIIMGCYGIGVSRVLAAILEQNYDERGIIWPASIAPFAVHLLTVHVQDEVQMKLSDEIYKSLSRAGLTVLWDDREERPGVKFNDADLLGFPLRITVGKKAGENIVECKERRSGQQYELTVQQILTHCQTFFQTGGRSSHE
ncbi:proline--tRNA ligase [Paenibacillus aceris]|uniref:Proline--tRNA ligase n=1 Tax=Paenibacillus aceris TaxID=869555 RepID=A0ABS4HTE8_9BACL|nr:proline--tRNA ligase [Paenibacillus aceris]MBP1961906.1 prolyl-tRNA synthetase [Paenibacillus aceris]NHW34243.1 proline--tRNA ligase [Paenibacillus aceris]